MTIETLFSLCNFLVLPGWALLILAPRWQWTLGVVSSGLIPFVLALVYAGLFASRLSLMPAGGGFGSLEALMVLYTDPYLITVGWIHYLAFDLFVGCWELRDAQDKGIAHWLVVPCLLMTFILGPVGLGAYFILRFAKTGQLRIHT
jgi:hypothetical protein